MHQHSENLLPAQPTSQAMQNIIQYAQRITKRSKLFTTCDNKNNIDIPKLIDTSRRLFEPNTHHND